MALFTQDRAVELAEVVVVLDGQDAEWTASDDHRHHVPHPAWTVPRITRKPSERHERYAEETLALHATNSITRDRRAIYNRRLRSAERSLDRSVISIGV